MLVRELQTRLGAALMEVCVVVNHLVVTRWGATVHIGYKPFVFRGEEPKSRSPEGWVWWDRFDGDASGFLGGMSADTPG